jgi:hypothetical protein
MAAPLDWRFLHAAPPHYVALRLLPDERLSIDGKLDDPAWATAQWTRPFVDITRRASAAEGAVPASLQVRAKLRYDASFLYVGAELYEPFVTANITGHNGPQPPYHDNDFEAFFDVSGSSQYYKEFEMSALNATCEQRAHATSASSSRHARTRARRPLTPPLRVPQTTCCGVCRISTASRAPPRRSARPPLT